MGSRKPIWTRNETAQQGSPMKSTFYKTSSAPRIFALDLSRILPQYLSLPILLPNFSISTYIHQKEAIFFSIWHARISERMNNGQFRNHEPIEPRYQCQAINSEIINQASRWILHLHYSLPSQFTALYYRITSSNLHDTYSFNCEWYWDEQC